jgi:hypothetical protein
METCEKGSLQAAEREPTERKENLKEALSQQKPHLAKPEIKFLANEEATLRYDY